MIKAKMRSKRQKDPIQKFHRQCRSPAVGYSVGIKCFRGLAIGYGAEILHWDKHSRCGDQRFMQAIYRIQCENSYKQKKIGKKAKILNELSDIESLDGSITDSETEIQ
jgi:hypothetical protein